MPPVNVLDLHDLLEAVHAVEHLRVRAAAGRAEGDDEEAGRLEADAARRENDGRSATGWRGGSGVLHGWASPVPGPTQVAPLPAPIVVRRFEALCDAQAMYLGVVDNLRRASPDAVPDLEAARDSWAAEASWRAWNLTSHVQEQIVREIGLQRSAPEHCERRLEEIVAERAVVEAQHRREHGAEPERRSTGPVTAETTDQVLGRAVFHREVGLELRLDAQASGADEAVGSYLELRGDILEAHARHTLHEQGYAEAASRIDGMFPDLPATRAQAHRVLAAARRESRETLLRLHQDAASPRAAAHRLAREAGEVVGRRSPGGVGQVGAVHLAHWRDEVDRCVAAVVRTVNTPSAGTRLEPPQWEVAVTKSQAPPPEEFTAGVQAVVADVRSMLDTSGPLLPGRDEIALHRFYLATGFAVRSMLGRPGVQEGADFNDVMRYAVARATDAGVAPQDDAAFHADADVAGAVLPLPTGTVRETFAAMLEAQRQIQALESPEESARAYWEAEFAYRKADLVTQVTPAVFAAARGQAVNVAAETHEAERRRLKLEADAPVRIDAIVRAAGRQADDHRAARDEAHMRWVGAWGDPAEVPRKPVRGRPTDDEVLLRVTQAWAFAHAVRTSDHRPPDPDIVDVRAAGNLMNTALMAVHEGATAYAEGRHDAVAQALHLLGVARRGLNSLVVSLPDERTTRASADSAAVQLLGFAYLELLDLAAAQAVDRLAAYELTPRQKQAAVATFVAGERAAHSLLPLMVSPHRSAHREAAGVTMTPSALRKDLDAGVGQLLSGVPSVAGQNPVQVTPELWASVGSDIGGHVDQVVAVVAPAPGTAAPAHEGLRPDAMRGLNAAVKAQVAAHPEFHGAAAKAIVTTEMTLGRAQQSARCPFGAAREVVRSGLERGKAKN